MMVVCVGVFFGCYALHLALLAGAVLAAEVVLALATIVVGSVDFFRYLQDLDPEANRRASHDDVDSRVAEKFD